MSCASHCVQLLLYGLLGSYGLFVGLISTILVQQALVLYWVHPALFPYTRDDRICRYQWNECYHTRIPPVVGFDSPDHVLSTSGCSPKNTPSTNALLLLVEIQSSAAALCSQLMSKSDR